MATETQGEVIRSGSKRVPGLRIKLQGQLQGQAEARPSMILARSSGTPTGSHQLMDCFRARCGHHIRCGQHSTPTFLAALRKSVSSVASGILFLIASSK